MFHKIKFKIKSPWVKEEENKTIFCKKKVSHYKIFYITRIGTCSCVIFAVLFFPSTNLIVTQINSNFKKRNCRILKISTFLLSFLGLCKPGIKIGMNVFLRIQSCIYILKTSK